MAPLLRHALLLPVLTATFAATAIAGKSGGAPLGAPVAATTTTPRAGQQDSSSTRSERKSQHSSGKEETATLLHTSPQRQDEHQREIRERLWRRRRRRQQQEQQQQQQQRQEQQIHQTRGARGPQPSNDDDHNNNDSDISKGKAAGHHDRDDDDKSRRRGPLGVLAAVGDGIKTRAQQPLLAVPGAGEQQQEQRRRQRVGWTARREEGFGRRKLPLAFGNPLAGNSGEEAEEEERDEEEELRNAERLAVQAENDASMEAVMSVIESEGWEHVTNKSGVTVVRKFLPPPSKASTSSGIVDEGAAAKFACVKAMGTLDADASELYKLFLDNERVHEYNDNCKEVRDVEQLTEDTKVSWASTPRYGPFKSRDFVTAVHYRTLEDGTMMVINRPVEHPAAKRSKKFVRAEILIATNIMRPNREDPSKTDFISVTHINPGGIADTTIGAKVVNKLCAKAPVNLLVALERSANSAPVPKKEKAVKVASG